MSKEERHKELERLCNEFATTYMILKSIPYSEQQAPILKNIERLFGE
jgi:hypothetical protein